MKRQKPNAIQQEILDKFKEIGIKGHLKEPYVQKDSNYQIIPNKNNEGHLVLKY